MKKVFIVGFSTLVNKKNLYDPHKCAIFLSNSMNLYVVRRCIM